MNERKFVNIANTSKKAKHNLEVDVIQYCLIPSLQHISAVNIIITLWRQKDIKHEIVNLFSDDIPYYTNFDELWEQMDGKVLRQVSHLPVPERIRNVLSNIVHPIRQEMCDWLEYNDTCIFNSLEFYAKPKPIAANYIDDLVWTSRGRIDYKQTAKALLAREELSDCHYSIACANCFEDNIAIIASNAEVNYTLYRPSFRHRGMVYFWTAHITGNFTELDKEIYTDNYIYETNYTANECLFRMLIHNFTNPVSIKYIWDTLNEEEKSRMIVPAIQGTYNTDIRCFLLSQMSREQQKEVFKSDDASKILLCFLDDWLWGHYFLPTLHQIWDIISGSAYLAVLKTIKNKIREYSNDIQRCNSYKAIFKDSWKCAPKHLKEYSVKHWRGLGGSCDILF